MTDTENTQNPTPLTKSQKTNKRRAGRSEDQIIQDQRRLRPKGAKVCPKCKGEYPLSHFTRDIYRADGLMTLCSACWAIVRQG